MPLPICRVVSVIQIGDRIPPGSAVFIALVVKAWERFDSFKRLTLFTSVTSVRIGLLFLSDFQIFHQWFHGDSLDYEREEHTAKTGDE